MKSAAAILACFLSGWALDAVGQDPGEEAGQAAESSAGKAPEERRRGVRRLGDVVSEGGEEWGMDLPSLEAPLSPVEEQPRVSLPDPDQDAELQHLLTRRAFAPDDPGIAAELAALLDDVEAQARAALAADDVGQASRLVEVIATFDQDRAVIQEVRAERDRLDRVEQLLVDADRALAEGELLDPVGRSALDLYRQVLELDPDSRGAERGLVQVQLALMVEAIELAREMDFEAAEELVDLAEAVRPSPELIAETRGDIAAFRTREIDRLAGAVRETITGGAWDEAEDGLTQLIAMGANRGLIEELRTLLADVRTYGGFEPGQSFSDPLGIDGLSGPEMIVIPAGNFMMGSPDNERDRVSNEGPRFRVTFERGFALARTEITVGEFRVFVEDTGHVTDAERAGHSRTYNADSGRLDRRGGIYWIHDYMGERADDDLPVLHVSWHDATAYARWLSARTGRDYRLPSEAEFEYALRAGTQTPYWWGEGSPDRPVENVTGDGDRSTARRSWTVAFRRYSSGFWGPAPVGSLEANPFGLYDMGGNVMEWVEDCWHDRYVRAPNDGSAWVNPGCARRMLRGGAWTSTPAMSRSAFRISSTPDDTDARVGFRVARDL